MVFVFQFFALILSPLCTSLSYVCVGVCGCMHGKSLHAMCQSSCLDLVAVRISVIRYMVHFQRHQKVWHIVRVTFS